MSVCSTDTSLSCSAANFPRKSLKNYDKKITYKKEHEGWFLLCHLSLYARQLWAGRQADSETDRQTVEGRTEPRKHTGLSLTLCDVISFMFTVSKCKSHC